MSNLCVVFLKYLLIRHQKISKSIFFSCTLERLKTPKKAFLALFKPKIFNFFIDIFDIFRYFTIYVDISIFADILGLDRYFLPIFLKIYGFSHQKIQILEKECQKMSKSSNFFPN